MKHIKYTTLIIVALAMAACGKAPVTAEATPIPTVIADKTIISEGRLEPIQFTQLSLSSGGQVSEVLFSKGDSVTAGDVIAVIESDGAQSLESAQTKASQDLTLAYQEVSDAQEKLDFFDPPSKFDGMSPAEAAAAMLVNLNKARADFVPFQHLNAKKLELTEAEEKNKVLLSGRAKIYKKALDNAWAYYRLAIDWLDRDSTLRNAQVKLELARRDYEALQDPNFAADTAVRRAILANAELRSPFPGLITDLSLKAGEYVTSGEPVVTIADTSKWLVKTKDLTEIDVVNIKDGQPVTVKFDALPGMEFKGNVLSIGDNFSENQGDVVYEVTILLTESNAAMRWGMTAVVTFEQ